MQLHSCQSGANRPSAELCRNVCVRGLADRRHGICGFSRLGGNRRCRTGREHSRVSFRSDLDGLCTGNGNVPGNNHPWIYPDPRNFAAWNRKPDAWDGEPHSRSFNSWNHHARLNYTRNLSNNPNARNLAGDYHSGNNAN